MLISYNDDPEMQQTKNIHTGIQVLRDRRGRGCGRQAKECPQPVAERTTGGDAPERSYKSLRGCRFSWNNMIIETTISNFKSASHSTYGLANLPYPQRLRKAEDKDKLMQESGMAIT